MIIGSHKVIIDTQKNSEEIYDLDTDPSETKNLVDELGDRAATELRLTRSFFETHARPK
jgi:hypothetical protein